MTASQILITELRAMTSVLICAFCLFLLGMLKGVFAPDSIYADPLGSPLLVSSVVLIIGLPIAVFYGAPLYLLLGRTGPPKLLAVLAVGAVPALLFATAGPYMVAHALAVGVGSAWLTHLLSGPNLP